MEKRIKQTPKGEKNYTIDSIMISSKKDRKKEMNQKFKNGINKQLDDFYYNKLKNFEAKLSSL